LDDFHAAANVWLKPVCALSALSPTDEREFVLFFLVAQWAQILFTSGTLNMLCSG
jgi:hypothetical protein